ncbi:MAG: ATP-dependent DNA helicase [Chthonomonas sp.]|nr:ATP-dependent DNA helicase [Chthonomonas sp.]
MPNAPELMDAAFARLAEKPGMEVRESQLQLARLISDCINMGCHGAFEAPTGLGKSFAGLVPAIAHALASEKRIVIATFTNVLTEQYWRKDLPFALSLFDDRPSTQLLLGRQRFACLAQVAGVDPQLGEQLQQSGGLGIESEFRGKTKMKQKEFAQLWKQVSAPPTCPARACEFYDKCFYYEARRRSANASLVITNQSVVIQDALLKATTGGEANMLGDYDYLIVDEAHDFHSAAQGGLEFEISESVLRQQASMAMRIFESCRALAMAAEWEPHWRRVLELVMDTFSYATTTIGDLHRDYQGRALVAAMPPELYDALKQMHLPAGETRVEQVTSSLAANLKRFLRAAEKILGPANPGAKRGEQVEVERQVHNYRGYLDDFAGRCELFMAPAGTAISYVGGSSRSPILRNDLVELGPTLSELIWQKVPTTCMSATLAVDHSFEFIGDTIGFRPEVTEILPSPFDFPSSMSAYVPEKGRIPDPTAARQGDFEAEYFTAIAAEIQTIIELVGGRTLCLFHSRREMEAVAERVTLPEWLPVFTQASGAVSTIGDKFKKDPHASLFGLRSFWTGFDAPGDTLSCVIVVRIPFEVPIEPLQIARQAWMGLNQRDSFQEWTIPSAKMLMRQGIGRLIRKDGDRGLVALLDPRLTLKPYGESFLENLPDGVRSFSEAADAVGHVGFSFLEA